MAVWTADRRLYLAADGVTVVEEGDPRKASLLVPVGGTLPMERARALGLIVEPAAAEEPQGKPAPANKLKKQPTEDK